MVVEGKLYLAREWRVGASLWIAMASKMAWKVMMVEGRLPPVREWKVGASLGGGAASETPGGNQP
jgi:hypothetical protein